MGLPRRLTSAAVTQPSSRYDDQGRRPSPARTGPAADDWAAQAATKVEEVVVGLREKTTAPILKGARGAIWGVLVVFLVVIAIVLAYAALLRGLDELLPWGVWAAHLVLGIVFTACGVVIGLKGRAPDEEG